ncbi:hypothetical protein MBLNU459_g6907t2 [Dothideomycetes sp. NU459]
MGLEDFEKELAATTAEGSSSKRQRSRSRDRDRDGRRHRHRHKDRNDQRRHHHHRHHDHDHGHGHDHRPHHPRSSHPGDEPRDDDRRRHKRRHDDGDDRRRDKRRRSGSPRRQADAPSDQDDWVEKEAMTAPPGEETLDERLQDPSASAGAGASAQHEPRKRDSWMEAPSAVGIDYVQRNHPRTPPSQFVPAKEQHARAIHQHEVEQLLRDLDEDEQEPDDAVPVDDRPAQHGVAYTFGDSGSQWRMTKLRNVRRQAEESGRPVDEVALERYGHLRDFDDAREEERELDRRSMYGKDYVGLEKPSGELFQDRKQQANIHRETSSAAHGQTQLDPEVRQGIMEEAPSPARTLPLDQTALNKLKAQMMKAKLRNAPNAADLEAEYNAASSAAAASHKQPDVLVLSAMENRMLTGGRGGEVKQVENKRGRERGTVEENEDMTIEDMVRQEKRSRGTAGGEGRVFAERIAKDGRFTDNLDYMDDNAANLAKRGAKSDINLRNMAVGDFQKMQKILDSCPLCHHEDSNTPPAAPIVSLATRVYMTLPTEPEITPGGAVIVPIQHHLSLLECDDDEWEEIRNFMKSLTRMYHERDKGVIFYENAAFMHSRKGHAALFAIPLPFHLADNAPAFFKEAVLSADEEWSQHKKIIDTLAASQRPGYGKQAFRKSLVKEMPYFHVWFNMDGGLGHVIEDERRWPRGDLFAREIIGGMLAKGPEVIKKQGRWIRQDPRVEGFRKRWNQFDWTRVLMDQ